MPKTKAIDALFLELSQFTGAMTEREARLREAVSLLNNMVENGQSHTDETRRIAENATDPRPSEYGD